MSRSIAIAALETFYEYECLKPQYIRTVDEEGYIVKSDKGIDLYRNFHALRNALQGGNHSDIENESYQFAKDHNITLEGVISWYKSKYSLNVTGGKKWANARNTYHL